MDERCIDCPWFDNAKKTCCRKPPRFCDVDASSQSESTPAAAGAGRTEAGPSPAPASAHVR